MNRPDDKPPMSRRGLLAALGGLGAAAGAAACRRGWVAPESDPTALALAKPYVPGSEAFATHEERWIQTACGECPASCGVRVRVVEGRAVRIEGNRDNPLNQGGIGPRGLSALQGLYDPDRVTTPLERRGGALVPIGWDEALVRLAGALRELRDRGEPDRLLVWTGQERGPMVDLLARFCRVFGTPNFIDGRPGHSAVMAQAMAATVGSAEVPVYGWDRAGYILSLEAGLLEDSCQLVHFTRMAARLRRDGERRPRMVHAGAMLDLSAANADEWVRIRPGTSGALALGLAGHILAQHPEPAVLPPELCAGAAEFRAFAAGFTAARVETITGVPPRTLARLADELWAHRPALVVVGERSLGYSNGLDTALVALALNAVLGGFWEPGLGVRPAPEAPLRAWPEPGDDAVAAAGLARPRLDGAPAFPRATSVHETLPEAIATAGARGPAVALLHQTNPVHARQQPRRWREALDAIPLVVCLTPYMDDTVTAAADLVLPDHTFLERWEAALPAPAIDRAMVALRVPAVAPLHHTRAAGDVVLDLARRIGGHVARALDWPTYRDAVEARLLGLHESHRGQPATATPGEFLRELHRTGFWIDAPPASPPPTRVTLHSAYAEPTWYGDEARHPLRLLVHRPLGHGEDAGNRPWLRMLRAHPGAGPWSFAAAVHPSSAPGRRDGETVRLISEWGRIELPLRLDDRMEPGYVAVPLGGGHQAGRWAVEFGANVLDLVRPGAAPVTGAALTCATRVRIASAEEDA